MPTQTPPSSHADSAARANAERVERYARATLERAAETGGYAARALGRFFRDLAERWRLTLGVIVGALAAALVIWYLVAHAPAALLFVAQVVVVVVIALVALAALLWVLLWALARQPDESPDGLASYLGPLIRGASRLAQSPSAGSRAPLSMLEKRRLAYSEAGHAVALAALAPDAPVAPISIRSPRRPSTLALGAAAPRSAEEVFATLQVALASRAAQEVFLQARLVSAAGDLAAATALALRFVACWGLGDALLALPSSLPVERLAADTAAREQAERLLRQAYDATRALLEHHRAEVIALAEALAEREALDGAEVAEILRKANSPTPEQHSALTSVAETALFGSSTAPDFQEPAPHVIGPVAAAPAAAGQPASQPAARVSRVTRPVAFAASPSQELRADRVIDRAILRAPLQPAGARRTDPDLPAISNGANGGSGSAGANGASGGSDE